MKKISVALMCLILIISLASCAGGVDPNAAGSGPDVTGLSTLLMLPLFLVIFYFFLLRPQKKQDQEIANMRESIALGDIIITRGGIVGRVVRIKDDMMLIETGGNKTRIQIQKTAVSEIKAKANADSEEEKK